MKCIAICVTTDKRCNAKALIGEYCTTHFNMKRGMSGLHKGLKKRKFDWD